MKLIEIFSNSPKNKVLMSGNEALVRGIFESGFKFANPFHAFAYSGIKKGTLILSIANHDILISTNAQDNRLFLLHRKIPIFEPASVQECKDFIREGFRISELYDVPIYIYISPVLYHCYGVVEYGEIKHPNNAESGNIKISRNVSTFLNLLANQELKNKLGQIENKKELFHLFNKVKIKDLQDDLESIEGQNIGIITTGINYSYVIQACSKLKINPPILKFGLVFPINQDEIREFVNHYEIKSLFVIEELDSFIEDFLMELSNNFYPSRRNIDIYGKNFISNPNDLDTSQMMKLFSQYFPVKVRYLFEDISRKEEALKEIIPTLACRP